MSAEMQTQTILEEQHPQDTRVPEGANKNPPPQQAFNPFSLIKSADGVFAVDQCSLSSIPPVTPEGLTAKQTFVELSTASLLINMVVVLPRFAQEGNQPTSYDSMLVPASYYLVKSRSISGDSIFPSKLQLGQGTEHENQALINVGLENSSQVQLASSDVTTVLVLAHHVLEAFKAALVDTPPGSYGVHQREPQARRCTIQVRPFGKREAEGGRRSYPKFVRASQTRQRYDRSLGQVVGPNPRN